MEDYNEPIDKTVEYLIGEFPEGEGVTKGDIAEAVKSVFNGGVKYYQEIRDVLYNALHKVLPYPTDEQWNENFRRDKSTGGEKDYVDRYWDYAQKQFREWSERVESYFRAIRGARRTYGEACGLVADKWCELLFGSPFQDNGDRSGHSDGMMFLGTLLKSDAQKNITPEIMENVHNGIEKFYLHDCMWESEGGSRFRIDLSCDYYPNTPFYEILLEAGVKEDDIRSICPWKTGIEIDRKDNAVMVRQYRERNYF